MLRRFQVGFPRRSPPPIFPFTPHFYLTHLTVPSLIRHSHRGTVTNELGRGVVSRRATSRDATHPHQRPGPASDRGSATWPSPSGRRGSRRRRSSPGSG